MIRLSKSVVGEAEAKAVGRIIQEVGYLGMGETVGEFERALEAFVGGGRRCLCVNSGTAALHLAVQAVTQPGDEVLVPSFTFVASYQAIQAAGCKPVSCELRRDTLTLDLRDAERRITEKTRALMPVYYGSNCRLAEEYQDFARRHGLRLIEDAAHAFGCSVGGRMIGSFGDIVCFSFDGIKNITSGEGGAVFTNDAEVIRRVSDARLLGVEKDSEARYQGKRTWDFDVVERGYRYHMSNIFAAIGLVQLSRFPAEFAPRRRAIAMRYTQLLRECKHVRLVEMDYEHDIVPHIFPIEVLDGKREAIVQKFKEEEIQYGIQYLPNHLLSLFRTPYALPETEDVYRHILSLPIHPELTEEEILKITNIIKNT